MKKSNLLWCVALVIMLAGCGTGDADAEGTGAVAKTIEVTGMSGIGQTARIDVNAGDPNDPLEYGRVAEGDSAVADDQTLSVELYEWTSEGGRGETRWTGDGPWCIRLWLAEGDDYFWKSGQQYDIKEEVTTLLFEDFTPSADAVFLTGITVTGPTKTGYTTGEPFDTAGLVVTAHYSDGTEETVPDYALTWSGAALAAGNTAITAAAGSKTVTVSYQGKSATFTIAVSAAVTLTSITVTGPTKTDYTEGEPFDPAGLVVTARYSDETEETVPDYTLTWNGADLADGDITAEAGDKTVTVSYGDKSATFTIVVSATGGASDIIVTFDADGGSPATQTMTVTSGWVALPTEPVRAGYPFLGWYTLTDGGGTPFTGSTTVTAALTVYAKWVITTVAELTTYLGAAGTTSTTAPILVSMKVNLADGTDGWAKILQALAGKGKYVTLNLSDCTMSGTAFDPGTASTGKSYITGLALPDAAASILAGASGSGTFKDFGNLKTLSAAEVETVGDNAFRVCASLETVSLPKATTIGETAFNACSGLKTVSLPEATTIGRTAFNDCKGLTTVYLPEAATIDFQAFYGCTSLTTVSLPAVTTIGYGAFMGCTGLTTMTMPAAPPTYGGAIFYETSGGSSSTITITVPSTTAVAAYISKWKVVAETGNYGNTNVYGYNHKAVTIKAAVQ